MKKHITAFYLETLLLIMVFVAIILVLTGVFSGARAQSVHAANLTRAVELAENAAEAVSASDSLETLQSLLDENGNTQRNGDILTVFQDEFQVDISWKPEGEVVSSTIAVSRNEAEIYTLETAVYAQEVGR